MKNAALVDVVGQKSWVVDEAKELPSSITVKLLADGEEIDEKEINENDDWKYSFKDLDKYNEENDEIEYDIKEAGIDGYNSYNEGFNLINIQTKEVTGSKEWIGGHSVKPDIELQLFRNDASYGDPVVLKDGETSYTWTELDKTDMDGKEYKYTVDEVRVPSDYSKSISEDGLTITNRYSPPSDPIDPKPIIPEGRIRIIKRDSDSNELLKGAEFQIINSDDRIVNTLITNSQGSATSKYLPLGTYTIKEVKAPKGYKIMTEVTTNTITNGVTDEVVIYNELDKPEEPKPVDPEDTEDPEEPEEPEEPKDPKDPDEEDNLDGNTPGGKPKVPGLPVTGSKDSILFYTIGLLSIIIGLALRRKTKHNN